MTTAPERHSGGSEESLCGDQSDLCAVQPVIERAKLTDSPTAGTFLSDRLFEFFTAQINCVDSSHMGDIFERVPLQYEQIGGFALGECAEILFDAERL
jgi:hypothetical protein